jgi:hypothetical protein
VPRDGLAAPSALSGLVLAEFAPVSQPDRPAQDDSTGDRQHCPSQQ